MEDLTVGVDINNALEKCGFDAKQRLKAKTKFFENPDHEQIVREYLDPKPKKAKTVAFFEPVARVTPSRRLSVVSKASSVAYDGNSGAEYDSTLKTIAECGDRASSIDGSAMVEDADREQIKDPLILEEKRIRQEIEPHDPNHVDSDADADDDAEDENEEEEDDDDEDEDSDVDSDYSLDDPNSDSGAPSSRYFAKRFTVHVGDYLHNEYYFDETTDDLWVKIPTGAKKYSGHCASLLKSDANDRKSDMFDIMVRYKRAIDQYKLKNERVQELFSIKDKYSYKYNYKWKLDSDFESDSEFESESESYSDPDSDEYYDGDLHYDLYRVAIPERNAAANRLSKLYFRISQIPATESRLEHLAMRVIANHKLNIDKLPESMRLQIEQLL